MRMVSRVAIAFLACTILSGRAETLVALMPDKTLRHFDTAAPGVFFKTVNLTGIPNAQTVAALDFRPDGSLVLVTTEGNDLGFFFVNPDTGACVNANFLVGVTGANAVAFDTFPLGIHPNVDLAVATETDRMVPLFLAPGQFSGDGNRTLAYDNSSADGDPIDEHAGADPSIVALASTNSALGAKAHDFYGIDSTQNSLVKIEYATGSMDTVATLRNSSGATVLIGFRTGFDISGTTGVPYLMFGSGDVTSLLTVDLTTGLTTNLGQIGPAPQPGGVTPVDLAVLAPTRLLNISTRSRVGTGEDVVIAGFIAPGGAPARFIIRGIGPSLAAFGVANALADPVLTIFDGNGIQIATNDNWKSNQQSAITSTGLAPTNDLEAAFTAVLPAGAYTAILAGKNGGTGVGLIEVFHLPDL